MAAWVLNLDADYELAAGSGYEPRRAVLLAMKPHVDALAARLLGPDDVVITDGQDGKGMVGRAWSPTPRAIATMVRAGAAPAPSPSFEVLREVTSRAFHASMGQTLAGAVFATTFDDAVAAMARPGVWRLKRAFGMAGREHRIVPRGAASEADLGFVRASIAEGGVQIEPQLEIVRELAMHGMIEGAAVTYGPLFEQRCDSRGAWLASIPISDPSMERAMGVEAARAAEALRGAGYFGPFGIDGFVHREGLQARSEVNARYSMGYPRALVPR